MVKWIGLYSHVQDASSTSPSPLSGNGTLCQLNAVPLPLKKIICDVINWHLVQIRKNLEQEVHTHYTLSFILIAIHNGMPSNGLDEHPQQGVR